MCTLTRLFFNSDPYEPWSKWSECSTQGKEDNGESCGKGKRERSRKCKKFILDGKEKAVKEFCRYSKVQKVESECDLGPCQKASRVYLF